MRSRKAVGQVVSAPCSAPQPPDQSNRLSAHLHLGTKRNETTCILSTAGGRQYPWTLRYLHPCYNGYVAVVGMARRVDARGVGAVLWDVWKVGIAVESIVRFVSMFD